MELKEKLDLKENEVIQLKSANGILLCELSGINTVK